MKVSIILPSLNRSAKLIATILNLIYTTKDYKDVEIITILDDDDLTSKSIMDKNKYPYIVSPPNSFPTYKWNYGALNSSGHWIYQCSDDILHPSNWLEKCLNTPNSGFLAINDGKIGKQFEPFYMATRDWLIENQHGVLAVPHYRHWGNDMEIAARARRLGHYQLAHGVVFEHLHFIYHKAKKDSTYARAEKFYKKDIDLFNERAELGFPDDFDGVL